MRPWPTTDLPTNALVFSLWCCAVCVPSVLALVSSPAHAQPASGPRAEAHMGRPARPLTLTVREGRAAGAELLADGRTVAPLPFVPTALAARAVTLDGAAFALVDASRSAQVFSLLLARRGARVVVLDSGRTDLSGDPGERRAHLLTVVGDGPDAQVVRGTVAERFSVCGSPATWLDTQVLDPRTLSFRSQPVPPPPPRTPTQTHAAQPTPDAAPPRLDALRFDVASSGAGESSFDRAPRPAALTDGDASTAWVEAEATDGGLAFASGRYDASDWPVRTITLVPVATGAAAHVRAPAYIDVAGPDALVRVQLPPDPSPGQRYVVQLDPPVPFRCVSVLMPTVADAHTQVGLAEFALHSPFEGEDGPDLLLAELARGGARGVSAARLLRGLGATGASAIANSWPDMTPRERRLALRVLADLGGRHGIAREALVRAARDDDPEIHAAALEALRSAGAGNELTTLMREGDDDAAQVLARAIPGRALAVLLPALAAEGGVAREGLRGAIAEALLRASDEAVPHAAAWASDTQPVEASALVAQALGAAGDGGAQLGASLLRDAAPRAQSFEETWRVVVAAASLPADPELDAWLEALVQEDERWMLRAEAATSLRARMSPRAVEAARALAEDAFPRARERAATLLPADEAGHVALLLRMAQRDPWPRVRAAAVTALARDDDARAQLVGALGDPKARVRLAAIEAFRITEDARGAEAIAARLARPNEVANVQRAAARYLGQVCAAAHVDTLIEAVARGRRPNAYDPDIQTAIVAVAALARLGTPEARSYLESVRAGGPPEGIRAAAARGLSTPAACEATSAR